jgi:hypothetical protein
MWSNEYIYIYIGTYSWKLSEALKVVLFWSPMVAAPPHIKITKNYFAVDSLVHLPSRSLVYMRISLYAYTLTVSRLLYTAPAACGRWRPSSVNLITPTYQLPCES